MSWHKQKQFTKILLVGLIFLLSLGFFNSGKLMQIKAGAATYKCTPNNAACCQTGIDQNAAEDCANKHPVVDNQDKGTTNEIGHCYVLRQTGYGPLYYNSSCAEAPFYAYQQASIDCNANDLNETNCGILRYLVIFINVLSGLVGIVITAVIIIAGIQYSSAGNDPQKIAAAKGRIVNALLALATFIFMYAFLQWVVPGGIF